MKTPEIGMTIDSLMTYLADKKREFGGETPVAFASQAGDHGRNILAKSPEPESWADLALVVWSDYHSENKVVEAENVGDDDVCHYTEAETVKSLVIGL